MRIVDDCPVSVSPMTDEVRRDLKEERDSELYQAMLEKVREEWTELGVPFKPDELAVHKEALRRLRNG